MDTKVLLRADRGWCTPRELEPRRVGCADLDSCRGVAQQQWKLGS